MPWATCWVSPMGRSSRRQAELAATCSTGMNMMRCTHRDFTNAWRNAIGYNNEITKALRTGTATKDDIINIARQVYKDYPELLNALGL